MANNEYRRAWELARDYLSTSPEGEHYVSITSYILMTDKSCLTKMGGKYPEQTVGVILRKRDDIFVRLGGGYYGLRSGQRP